ncbi:MAG: zf-HC2 domain-containing protein [Myxococcota bacterium]
MMQSLCIEVQNQIPWLLDDELEPDQVWEVERHVNACPACRACLDSEERLRATLRSAASSVGAPARLRRRLQESIALEQQCTKRSHRFWQAAAAAAIFAAFVWQGNFASVDDLDEATFAHSRDLPMDVVAGDVLQVQRYLSGKLPFRVQMPVLPKSMESLGGRITQLNNHAAAYVRYDTPDGRVSVFVYEDPNASPVEAGPHYRLGGRPVVLRRIRGYTTARWRSQGLVYSVVSDLPEGKLTSIWR